jgi:hypothetical protein
MPTTRELVLTGGAMDNELVTCLGVGREVFNQLNCADLSQLLCGERYMQILVLLHFLAQRKGTTWRPGISIFISRYDGDI